MAVRKHVGDTPRTKEAIIFAMEQHEGQVRKGSGLSYIVHPLEVWAIVRKYKESANIDELGAAAISHDLLEDTKTKYAELKSRYGTVAANLVQEVSNSKRKLKKQGKYEHQKRKLYRMSSYALIIKLADFLANMGEAPTTEAVERTARLCSFVERYMWDRLTETHKALLLEVKRTIWKLHGVE